MKDFALKFKLSTLKHVLTIILFLLPTITYSYVYKGTCGQPNVYWNLNTSTGILTISGNGGMTDYKNLTQGKVNTPWYPYAGSITEVKVVGYIQYIGQVAFKGCYNLTKVSIETITNVTIDASAFCYCNKLVDIYCNLENVPNIKTGNAFVDFNPQNATLHVPYSSINLYRETEPWSEFGSIVGFNSHILSYTVDGAEYKSYEILEGQAITPEEEPTKEGYTFSGWNGLLDYMPDYDITITGYFTINQYTINFDTNGGSTIESITQDYGSMINPPQNPTREGYTFIGWEPAIPETMPLGGLTVIAQWQANNYTLTYKVDGNVYITYSVACGTTITPELAPTMEGYTFSGWSGLPTTMPAHDVVVTGSFTINSYTLTYKVDGNVYTTFSVEYGTTLTPIAEPMKEGYTFSGWNGLPDTMPAGDVVVTGTFTAKSYTLTYKVDGNDYKTFSVDCGTAITPEAEPTKEGYTFSGWSEIPETMPAEDVTVTGTFTINQYLLTYILDDEEYKSYPIDYNTALTPEPVPTKKGMTFSGWGEMPETMPAHDVTLTGAYTWSKETVDGVVYQVADTLNNYATIVGYEGTGGEAELLSDIVIGGDVYEVSCIVDNVLSKTSTIYTTAGRLLLWLWTNGYDIVKETGTGRSLSVPMLSLVKATASSLNLSYINEYPELTETVKVSDIPVEKGANGYEIVLTGLDPETLYEGLASVTLTYEDASYTKSYSFRTEPLTLTTQQPKIISLGNVIVAAESNLDDEETNVGFEWRRTDWEDDFASNFGAAYLYDGMMEGYIRNLYVERLWRYRPYYESDSGNRYYGEWVGIDPTNTSYFEPTVHTYAQIKVNGNKAEVKGYAMRGTDNVVSQGFMYWPSNTSVSLRKKANSVPDNVTVVNASGNVMTATLEDLDYETTYNYVAFVTTSEGETFYGEEQSFSTSVDPDGIKEIKNDELRMKDDSSWYSLDGKKLAKPQKGINIIRYSDGTTKKVLIK